MQQMSSQELDRRITTFLKRKDEEFPELKLRRHSPEQDKVPSAADILIDFVAGIRWEFGR